MTADVPWGKIFIALGSRPKVGQQVLALPIWVRVLAPQPALWNNPCESKDFYPGIGDSGLRDYRVETKGREDLDDVEKIKRLKQWCDDVNATQKNYTYKMLLVKQEAWDKLEPMSRSLQEVVRLWGINSR